MKESSGDRSRRIFEGCTIYDPKQFGWKVRAAMHDRGMKPRVAAEEIGVSVQLLTRVYMCVWPLPDVESYLRIKLWLEIATSPSSAPGSTPSGTPGLHQ